jgi:AbiV family abortive infection protein
LAFVESGFKACWQSSRDLTSASQKLLDSDLHAPALSLSVLALEELGNLIAIDGLLFARQSDHEADAFRNAGRSQTARPTYLEVLPVFLANVARTNRRYGTEKRFNVALVMSLHNLKAAGNAVIKELGDDNYLGLDRWKQHGFHVSVIQSYGRFVTPAEAVSSSLAKAVHHLAWRATTTLDLVLTGALEEYMERARSVRAALTDEQHSVLERLGRELIAEIVGGSQVLNPGGWHVMPPS